jgi:hypothetical protein
MMIFTSKRLTRESTRISLNVFTNYHEKEMVYVSKKLIEECIDEMKPSNCFGWDGVNSNMIKKGKSNSLAYLTKSLINAIIYSGLIKKKILILV